MRFTLLENRGENHSPQDRNGIVSRGFAIMNIVHNHLMYIAFLLLQSSSQARDVFIELLAGRAVLPLLQGHLMTPAQVYSLNLPQISHHTGSVADQGHLEVQYERANVHVTRSNHGDVIVDGDVL